MPLVRTAIRTWEKEKWGYAFIAPSFVLFLLFFLIPVLGAAYLSLVRYTPLFTEWAGLENYKAVAADPLFWISLRNNALYALGVVPLWLGKALLISALIYPLSPRVQSFFKSAFYLPHVTSAVIMSMIWLWLYNPSFGLLNGVLKWIGLAPLNWLGSTHLALPAIIAMVVIMGGGSSIVLITASMGAIPISLYEAAALDGANRRHMFTRITVPLLRPTILYLVVMGTIGSFQVFENVYLMTQGGPQFSTMTLVYLIWETAFISFDFGRAAAQAMILFGVTFALGIVQFRLLSSHTEY